MAYAFAGEGRKVVVCTDLTAAEVAAFAARPGVKAVDLFGNPFDKAVYVPGTVVYLMTQQGES